jgi:hypothetical protein
MEKINFKINIQENYPKTWEVIQKDKNFNLVNDDLYNFLDGFFFHYGVSMNAFSIDDKFERHEGYVTEIHFYNNKTFDVFGTQKDIKFIVKPIKNIHIAYKKTAEYILTKLEEFFTIHNATIY